MHGIVSFMSFKYVLPKNICRKIREHKQFTVVVAGGLSLTQKAQKII